jgi:hypothetical protein
MEKLDRLGWAAGLSFVSYGLRIGVRVNEPELMDRILPRLPPGWKPSPAHVVHYLYSLRQGGATRAAKVRRFNLLYSGVARIGRTESIEELLETFERELHSYIASWAPRRLFVHAGVVGWRGRAIVVPGESYAGKTTLIAALVRAGATYYSDEYAVFDSRGRVYPFARPLQIRERGELRPRKCSPGDLGGRSGHKSLPVGLVALTEYRAGARWQPRALTPGKAVLALLPHAVPVRFRTQTALETVTQVVQHALILKGKRGEADATAKALLKRLA